MREVVKVLLHNFHYKIAAIAIACALWYVVQSEEIVEIDHKIEVEISVPDGMAVRGGTTRVKDVTLRGTRVALAAISRKIISARVVIPDKRVGAFRYRIGKEFISHWDPRIDLTVHDPYVTLHVDERAARRVLVKEVLQGTPNSGFVIDRIVVKPRSVTITGLKGDVARVSEIFTEPINIDGLENELRVETGLIKPENIDSLSDDSATIQISSGTRSSRRFNRIPVEAANNTAGAPILIRPTTVAVVLQGTPRILSGLRPEDVRATVDASGDTGSGAILRPVTIHSPAETYLVEVIPEKAAVEIVAQKKVE